MKLLITLLTLLTMTALISGSIADYWSSSVGTNTSTWSIYRQSDNVSFNFSSSIEGHVAPIEVRGRVLKPYQSYYAEVKENDVRLSQRTSAQEGNYRSDEIIRLRARNIEEVDISFSKPPRTDIYTFSFKEQWPVSLVSSRTLEYSGRRINNRDLQVNNNDFVCSNLLYNKNLSMDHRTIMWLDRLNATVLATDQSILLAELQPRKYLGYSVNMNMTGIADMTYRQISSKYDAKRRIYPVITESTERYLGTYHLARKIEMRSISQRYNDSDDYDTAKSWLSCCYGGQGGTEYLADGKFGLHANRIFDCTCQ